MATSIIAASDVGQPPLIMSVTAADTSLRIPLDAYRNAGMPRLLQMGEEVMSVTGVSSPSYTGVGLPLAVASADTVIRLPARHPFESLRYDPTAIPAGLGGTATAPTESGISVTALTARADGTWDATVTRTAGVAHAAGTNLFRTTPHDILTVTRGVNGTTALVHSATEQVERLLTADDFTSSALFTLRPVIVEVMVDGFYYDQVEVEPARWYAQTVNGVRTGRWDANVSLILLVNQRVTLRSRNHSVARAELTIREMADGTGTPIMPQPYWYGETTLTKPGAGNIYLPSAWTNINETAPAGTFYRPYASDPLQTEVLQAGHYFVSIVMYPT